MGFSFIFDLKDKMMGRYFWGFEIFEIKFREFL